MAVKEGQRQGADGDDADFEREPRSKAQPSKSKDGPSARTSRIGGRSVSATLHFGPPSTTVSSLHSPSTTTTTLQHPSIPSSTLSRRPSLAYSSLCLPFQRFWTRLHLHPQPPTSFRRPSDHHQPSDEPSVRISYDSTGLRASLDTHVAAVCGAVTVRKRF